MFVGMIPDGGAGAYDVVTPPPPPASPPPPPPDNTAYFLLNPVQPPPPPPPPVQSELPLPGGVAQIPGVFVTLPTLTAPPPPAPPSSDLDQAIADYDAQPVDTSPLPDFTLDDPFGIELLAYTNRILRGNDAVQAMIGLADLYGLDVLAVAANALNEGAGGGIGDGGTAFGPWQIHAEDGRIASFAGKPLYSPAVQAWAWSDNGFAYAARSMVNATPTARSKHGHAAVYAIVYGFERPADKAGAYSTRSSTYDHLRALGAGWSSYVASRMAGPTLSGGSGGAPPSLPGQTPPTATGVNASWRDVRDLIAKVQPAAGRHASAVGGRLLNDVH